MSPEPSSLGASGYVDGTHIKGWTKLRNKHVHPKEIDIANMSAGDYQTLIDLLNQTTVLMYHTVFYLIGYEGKYTDYATHGHPTKDYPLTLG
jgi:hypothetical protein